MTAISTATNTVAKTIKARYANAIAITPNGKTAYVTTARDLVIPIRTASNTPGAAIKVGQLPVAIAITPDHNHACHHRRRGCHDSKRPE